MTTEGVRSDPGGGPQQPRRGAKGERRRSEGRTPNETVVRNPDGKEVARSVRKYVRTADVASGVRNRFRSAFLRACDLLLGPQAGVEHAKHRGGHRRRRAESHDGTDQGL